MVNDQDSLVIKIVQSGELNKFVLSEKMLNRKLKDLLFPILKELKLKEKDVFLSIESGKMISSYYFNLTIKEIVEVYGTRLNLYSEKIM